MDAGILILGLGKSGRAAARALCGHGRVLWGWDDREEAWQGLESQMCRFPESSSAMLSEKHIQQLVVSPGVSPDHPLYRAAVELGVPVVGEAELAFRKLLGQKCLGVTGTNGKTTVTLLVAHVLQWAGIPAAAVGNVGIPLSDPVPENAVVVAELSSYQLETLRSPCLDGAVILNLSPDHFDRYGGMDAYVAAKAGIGRCLKTGAYLYVEWESFQRYSALFEGMPVRTFGLVPEADIYWNSDGNVREETVEYIFPVGYRGRSRGESSNWLGAHLLCRLMGVGSEDFAKAVANFKRPEHRLEMVAEIDGVTFVNDSKGTNVEAVEHAVQTIGGGIVLIVGGVDKGASYRPWIPKFKGKVRTIIALGQAAPRIRQELDDHYPITLVPSLQEAVKLASSMAAGGDTVLFSPGCSSFDMFKNYEHRGDVFKSLVTEGRQ